jgi:hypothetical protein
MLLFFVKIGKFIVILMFIKIDKLRGGIKTKKLKKSILG